MNQETKSRFCIIFFFVSGIVLIFTGLGIKDNTSINHNVQYVLYAFGTLCAIIGCCVCMCCPAPIIILNKNAHLGVEYQSI